MRKIHAGSDRYQNIQTYHLLQSMEGYKGIVLLKSNIKGN